MNVLGVEAVELVRGIIHVHSEFSSDGLSSVAELAGAAREMGLGFVGITDHAEDLSAENMRELCCECRKSSDGSLVVIPGLEFRCGAGIHMLGIGVTEHVRECDAVGVASEIRAKGGVAIMAHPSTSDYRCPRGLGEALDGVEIWNAAYDGRFAPPLANLRFLESMRGVNPAILRFGGADLHGLHRPPGVILQLRPDGLTPVNAPGVLQLLRSGRFLMRGRYVKLDARNSINWPGRARLWVLRKCYEASKAIRNVAVTQT